MKSKSILILTICAATALLTSGCSTQKTSTGRNNSFLGGLYVHNTGYYQPVGPNTIDIDSTQFMGPVNPSGTQVSLLWGTITCHNY